MASRAKYCFLRPYDLTRHEDTIHNVLENLEPVCSAIFCPKTGRYLATRYIPDMYDISRHAAQDNRSSSRHHLNLHV